MTPADHHPPEHVLAELAESDRDAEGELSTTASADLSRASEHVRGCEACQTVLRQLYQASRMLSELPARIPTPPHVSARIDATLATEAARGTAGDAVEPEPSVMAPARVASLEDRPIAWFRRRVPQLLSAAAAVALIGVVGYSFLDDRSGADVATVQGESAEDEGAGDGDDRLSMAESRQRAPGVEDAPADEEAGAPAEQPEKADAAAGNELSGAVLRDTLTEVWAARGEVAPGCGRPLADEIGSILIGSANVGEEIVVVLAEGEDLTGWLVPECSATSDVSESALTIPTPSG